MEQNKQKILKLLRWSVHLSFQVKPMIPNPKWCLAQPVFCWSCHQVRRLVKLYWCTEKLLLKRWAVEKGSLNSGSRRSGKRFPWCLCCPGGGRIISTWLQAREDLQYEVTLCTVAFLFAVFRAFSWIFPLRISSFIWSMLTSVDHVPGHLNLPHWWTGI